MKPLTKKGILKIHKRNPKDKQSLLLRDKKLHKTIVTKKIKRSDFNKRSLILTSDKSYS